MDHAWGYASDQRLREENEDTFGVFAWPGYTVFVVCDGMGGHAAGRQASELAVRTVWQEMNDLRGRTLKKAIGDALAAANKAVHEAGKRNRAWAGMGTTAVALVVEGDIAIPAHVGDSRLFMFRDGQARQVTRDHTMVNLFIDAQLLSPEEAASHPEAGVLSRSLGVEKNVEVEVGEPIGLHSGDAFLLCTDGVHGFVQDWEMAQQEWNDPQEAVRKVLWMVREREGDDNATLIGLTIDVPRSRGALPTPPPDLSEEPDLRARGGAPAAPSAPMARKPGEPAPLLAPTVPTLGAPKPGDPPQSAKAAPVLPPTLRRTQKKRLSPSSIYALAALGVFAATTTIGGMLFQRRATQRQNAARPALVELSAPSEAVASAPPDAANPVVTEAPPAATAETRIALFHPTLAESPKREPHRPQRFVAPPPSGAAQFEAVSAVRKKECAKSLLVVRDAMQESVDYAALYPQSWDCFQTQFVTPLTTSHLPGTDAESLAALPAVLAALEGPRANPLDWRGLSTDGLEVRLEAFLGSTGRDLLYEVMLDYRGPERLADTFAVDLLLEADLAAGLALIPEPTPEIDAARARRVYLAAAGLRGTPGELLRAHRPDEHARVVALLDAATRGAYSDPTARDALRADKTFPGVVLDALAAAEQKFEPVKIVAKVEDAPKPKPPPPPPPPPPEPPKEPVDDGVSMPKIYRTGG